MSLGRHGETPARRRAAVIFLLVGLLAGMTRGSTPAGAASAGAPGGCGTWTAVAGAPAGTTFSALAAASARDVWAVGSGPAGKAPAAERWDGASWHALPAPLAGRLLAVAALSPRDVWVAGTTSTSPIGIPLLQHWDGRLWRAAALPAEVAAPPGPYGGALYGLSAVSSTDVWAVGTADMGDRTQRGSDRRPLILHWNGARWASVPNVTHQAVLYGVSALSARDAWAVGRDDPNDVGYTTGATLAEHWDGTRWQVVPAPTSYTPNRLSNDRLLAVAALSPSDVWAVGATGNPRGGDQTLVEHWDGAAWHVVPSPNPAVGENVLAAVAAISGRDVWAVGSPATEPPLLPGSSYVLHWNGTTWTRIAGATPNALAATGPGDIWGAGTTLTHYQGAVCTGGDPVEGDITLPGAVAGSGTSSGLVTADHHVFGLVAPARLAVLDTTAPDLSRALLRVGTLPSGAGAVLKQRVLTADPRTHRVFVSSAQSSVVQVLDTRSATLVATAQVGVVPRLMAMAEQTSEVLVAGEGANSAAGAGVRLLDATTGAPRGTVPLHGTPAALAVDDAQGRAFVADAAGVHLLDLTVAPGPRAMLATVPLTGVVGLVADPRHGHLLAAYLTVSRPGYNNIPNVEVAVLDARTGAVLTPRVLGPVGNNESGYRACFQGMALDDATDRLFVASTQCTTLYGGEVSVVDTAAARLLAHVTVPAAPQAIAVDTERGHVFVSCLRSIYYLGGQIDGNGAVAMLDARSGALLRTDAVGASPSTLTVDQSTGRVFVATIGPWGQGRPTITVLDSGPPPMHVLPHPTPADAVAPSCCRAARTLYVGRTHHTLSDPFLSFYQGYGGLPAFGYPRTEPFVDGGRLTQYMDRLAVQLSDGVVRVLPLGRLLTARRVFMDVAPFSSTSTRRYFPQTGHALGAPFLAYWQAHHGSLLLGAPIAEPTREQNGDGSRRTYLVQWFENGRLEYHPELMGTRYEVQPGLVGKQALQGRGWLP